MARMVPALSEADIDRIGSAAERKVYRALRDQLPPETVVVHSVDLVGRTMSGQSRDLEADFVLFDENVGMLVIEVKGGGIAFDPNTGAWSSVDRSGCSHPIKDPFSQAKTAKHELLQFLRSDGRGGRGRVRHRFGTAHAVLFPDVANVASLAGPGRPPELVGGSGALLDVRSWLNEVVAFTASSDGGMGAGGMAEVERLFCQAIIVKTPLSLVIAEEQRRQVELTKRQARILRRLRTERRATVAGGAGTGKTLLALQFGRELAAQGLRTLIVCYNKPLGACLTREVGSTTNLHGTHFHGICEHVIAAVRREHGFDGEAQARAESPRGDRYALWLPMGLGFAVEYYKHRYDAIIIDEGQDFLSSYWLGLDPLLREGDNSRMYVFLDPNQAVYPGRVELPFEGPEFALFDNCRNTRHVHEAAYRYYRGTEVDPPDIEGDPIGWICAAGDTAQALAAKELVERLLADEELQPEDVVVLVADRGYESFFRALNSAGPPRGYRWTRGELWVPSGVVVESVRRFKGLEASVVVLCGFDDVDPDGDLGLMYVALTRARSRAWLIGEDAAIARVLAGPVRLTGNEAKV